MVATAGGWWWWYWAEGGGGGGGGEAERRRRTADKARVERDVVGNRGRGGGEGVVDGRWVVCVVCNRGGSAWWCRLARSFVRSLDSCVFAAGSTRQTT